MAEYNEGQLKERLRRLQDFVNRVAPLSVKEYPQSIVRNMTNDQIAALLKDYCYYFREAKDLVEDQPLPPLLRLWYIHYDDDGNDYSYFVRATSAEAAARFWRVHLLKEHEYEPGERVHVRSVKDEGPYGVVDWSKLDSAMVRNDGTIEEN